MHENLCCRTAGGQSWKIQFFGQTGLSAGCLDFYLSFEKQPCTSDVSKLIQYDLKETLLKDDQQTTSSGIFKGQKGEKIFISILYLFFSSPIQVEHLYSKIQKFPKFKTSGWQCNIIVLWCFNVPQNFWWTKSLKYYIKLPLGYEYKVCMKN